MPLEVRVTARKLSNGTPGTLSGRSREFTAFCDSRTRTYSVHSHADCVGKTASFLHSDTYTHTERSLDVSANVSVDVDWLTFEVTLFPWTQHILSKEFRGIGLLYNMYRAT